MRIVHTVYTNYFHRDFLNGLTLVQKSARLGTLSIIENWLPKLRSEQTNQNKPFGELFSKIRLKLAREFLILRNPTKLELRFSPAAAIKFSWKLVHIHIALREKPLSVLNLSFVCIFGITTATEIWKNIAKKSTFTSD